jgi:hypothetical protein
MSKSTVELIKNFPTVSCEDQPDAKVLSKHPIIVEAEGISKITRVVQIILFVIVVAFNATGAAAYAYDKNQAKEEATELLKTSALEGGRKMYIPGKGVHFNADDNVYVKSALAIKLTATNANVTLPIFKGVEPGGNIVYYIITESSDFNVAKQMGINYSPKLLNAVGSGGEQEVAIKNDHMIFKGKVDFSPVRKIVAGDAPGYFPPKEIAAGAVANNEWSSIVVLPSGQVLNVGIVSGDGGAHDRLVGLDVEKMTVTLKILDGFQGGKEYFFHLVTDASAEIAAVLEQGVLAPKLANIPEFGHSAYNEKSALLGFSPNANGITDITTGEGQGFAYSIRNNGADPINVFPYGPSNDEESSENNYSPLWDAHVSVWTDKAIKEGKVRRITSLEDQKQLITDGYLTSAAPDGDINPLTGLKSLKIIINCPVIAHPLHVK